MLNRGDYVEGAEGKIEEGRMKVWVLRKYLTAHTNLSGI